MDSVVILLVMAGFSYLLYRINSGLDYKWNFKVIPQYILRYDSETMSYTPNLLLEGLFTTIRLSVWGILLASFIGVVMGLLRVSSSLFNRLAAQAYVEMTRNLPPIVLIFIFYYFVSDLIMPIIGVEEAVRHISPAYQNIIAFFFAKPGFLPHFLSALFTLAVFEGAYITEIVRAGIQSIDKGQWEASSALGFTPAQQMIHVIWPQAFRLMVPPLGNQFISTIKDSAIVSVISIPELTFQGMEIMAATYLTFEVWIVVTLLYLILTLSLSFCVDRLEKRLKRKRTHL